MHLLKTNHWLSLMCIQCQSLIKKNWTKCMWISTLKYTLQCILFVPLQDIHFVYSMYTFWTMNLELHCIHNVYKFNLYMLYTFCVQNMKPLPVSGLWCILFVYMLDVYTFCIHSVQKINGNGPYCILFVYKAKQLA